ncbi:proton-dependent oligopeptide transporter family protein [Nitzschia inconspicua]|uniref:Proton-dependent oligopeptide transporter family protein n=1 Tax=Nitzschia inconspicua TaxID=303405 RepID=A0A9K3KNY4_9STRA|nr:proton-dependent oligopeptide transporter family protein [Nitzschia inconspicua]
METSLSISNESLGRSDSQTSSSKRTDLEQQQQQIQRDPSYAPYLEAASHNDEQPVLPPRPDDDLPTNIHEENQLSLLPEECLSGDKERPLRHVDDLGNSYQYSLSPMLYSVCNILVVETFERFSFYSICYTMTLFLTGAYDDDWNAGFTSVKAASFVSVSTMVAYSTPFVGAYLADSLLGDYKSILLGLLVFYIPGVLIIMLTTIPHLLGDEFNDKLLTLAVLCMWPMGTGIVKSIVNVFGAKQYHPVLQSSLIQSYYVSFYTVINVGALAGIGLIPILAQYNITIAYMVPMGLLTIGGTSLVLGTPRYVRTPPRARQGNVCCGEKRVGVGAPKSISLFEIFRIGLCIVPFCVGYNQMPTTFIVQGTVMSNAFGIFDVASMNSLDAISVLFFGSLTANYVYPYLAKHGIKIPTTYKFAIGSALGSMAIAWAIFVEKRIHYTYQHTGEKVNVLWQAPCYLLIGLGEIFAVSAAYEVAFTASPPDKKVLASACNIFNIGGLPNFLCIGLYHACSHWFENSQGNANIGHIEDYTTANVGSYFTILLCVMLSGVVLNVLPWVRGYVESIEERAAEIVKTPHIGKSPPIATLRRRDQETTPLVTTPRTKKYQEYLKYGSGPVYARSGSMRAGPSLSRSDLPGGKVKNVKRKFIPKLYGSDPNAGRPTVAVGPDGKPIRVGKLTK